MLAAAIVQLFIRTFVIEKLIEFLVCKEVRSFTIDLVACGATSVFRHMRIPAEHLVVSTAHWIVVHILVMQLVCCGVLVTAAFTTHDTFDLPFLD